MTGIDLSTTPNAPGDLPMMNRSARRARLLRVFAISAVLTLTIGLAVSCAFVAPEDIPALTSDAATLVASGETSAEIAEAVAPAAPTVEPTVAPTLAPTAEPTLEPTAEPTAPTEEPTAVPTPTPTATLEPTPEPTIEPTAVAVAVVQPSLMNARQGPGTDFPVVDKVTGGSEGTVLASGENGWVLVQFETIDEPVWISGSFAELTGNVAGILPLGQTAPITETEDATQPVTTTLALTVPTATVAPTVTPTATPSVPVAVISAAVMNVRSGPSTAYSIVTTAKAGAVADILGSSPDGQWYQVKLDGQDEPVWLYAGLTTPAGPLDQIAQIPEDQLPPTPTPAPAPVVSAPVVSASSSSLISAPAPTGGGSFGYGVQAHVIHTGQEGLAMDKTREMGFTWMKQQIEWRIFESSPGQYGFGDIGPIIGAANLRGINLLFSVVNAPDWAREPGFDANVGGPPQDPQTYANFVGRLAGEYCGSSLKAIEVWNEQNLHYEWGNKPLNPAEYMNLLRPAYAAIKNACPSMYVISGALTPAGNNGSLAMDDFAYLEGMFRNGVANYADGIGAHPSGYNVPASVSWQDACGVIQQTGNSFNGACDSPHHSWSFRSTMEGYRNIAVTYGAANKRIWPTEFGWAAGGAFHPAYAYANDNSYEEQAAWTVEAYQMMRNWGWAGPGLPVEPQLPRGGRRHRKGPMGHRAERLEPPPRL